VEEEDTYWPRAGEARVGRGWTRTTDAWGAGRVIPLKEKKPGNRGGAEADREVGHAGLG